jgi:CHAT domain
MSGISSAIQPQTMASFLPIVIDEKQYSIPWFAYDRSATDPELLNFTENVLKCFRKIEKAVKTTSSLTLDPDFGQKQLVELAKWGRVAHQRFFQDENARRLLQSRFQSMGDEIPAPTFISKLVPFPWEVLYHGNYLDADPQDFWGFRYTPARILTPELDISQHVMQQAFPSDMLFCLHHKLRQAHQKEWTDIRKLILLTNHDRCCLLTPDGNLITIETGESLLEYLDQAAHNMLHFACHCEPGDAKIDTLLISILQEDLNDEIIEDARVIKLGALTFDLIDGKFQRRPLIFLNACQSAGGSDELRKTFNLPQMFIKRGAGAVIATACPVPDLFAAAFAGHFYALFLTGQMTIGQALRETRLHFLKKHNNPLGLAYGLYSPAYYRLAQIPMMEGAI